MLVTIVDDSPSILSFLQDAIRRIEDCDVRCFLDPLEALASIAENTPDLMVVDYTMPKMNGVELVTRLRESAFTCDVPIIMLTSESACDIKMRAMEAGVTEFLNKPINAVELTIRVRNLMQLRRAQVVLARKASMLEEDIRVAREQLESQEEEIIWRLSRAISCRDGETAGHLTRVAESSKMIADELGLPARHARMIYLASPLHDVGKIGVRDNVLLKDGPLTEDERSHMRLHASFGAEVLAGSSSELIRLAEKIALGHHEKWNGKGYPQGLSGTDIPLEARIVGIADVFDALCSERPYKKAWPLQAAYQEILNGSERDFDPACVAAFCRAWPKIRALYQSQPSQAMGDQRNSPVVSEPFQSVEKVA